jgi:aminopeptidase YwaD
MTKNPYLDIDKKLMAEIYTSNETMNVMRELCDGFGSRAPGTDGDLESVKWMVEKLKSYGVDNAFYESYTIPGWKRGEAKLDIISPSSKNVHCISLPNSLAGTIQAELVDLGDGHVDIYDKRKDEIAGKIAMISSVERPKGMDRYMHRSEKFQRAVLAGAKGFIFVNASPGLGVPTGGINPIIPSLGISYEDGSYLSRLLENGNGVTLKMTTTDQNLDVESYNVICDVDGTGPDDEYLVVGCHYDGHDISQGSLDPLSGAVPLIEMARVINMIKGQLKRRIRFICFGAEEIGLFGSHFYVRDHKEELGKIRFMLNLDCAGLDCQKGVTIHDSPELEPFFKKTEKEIVNNMPIKQSVSSFSDHWPFFKACVPCGSGGDPDRPSSNGKYIHTCYDTVDKVNLSDLREAAANYGRLMFRIANSEDWSPKKKTAGDVAAFIEKQGLNDALELTAKVKDYVKTLNNIHPETQAWLDRNTGW